MSGTGGLQRLTSSFISNYKIPLPPLEIQEQIVAELDEYQKEIEKKKQEICEYENKIKEKIGEVWGEEI